MTWEGSYHDKTTDPLLPGCLLSRPALQTQWTQLRCSVSFTLTTVDTAWSLGEMREVSPGRVPRLRLQPAMFTRECGSQPVLMLTKKPHPEGPILTSFPKRQR